MKDPFALDEKLVRPQYKPEEYLTVMYTNHEGIVTLRAIRPIELYYGVCLPWHNSRTWLLRAYCTEKQDERTFEFKKLTFLEG